MKVNIGQPATMEEILFQREERAARIESLVQKYSKPVLSISVNIPGDIKLSENSKKVFDEACNIMNKALGNKVLFTEMFVENAGCYALLAVDLKSDDLKLASIDIEDNHPLGRLIDLDVIDLSMKHVSRTDMYKPFRKCLICDENAKICSRSRKHSVAELVSKFDEIVFKWEKTV